MNTLSFTRGMTVHSADGAVLGQIEQVWAQTASHGLLPVSRYLLQDYGPVTGTARMLATTDGVLQIRQDAFLGFGGRDLYVPLTAVQQIDPETGVRLSHTAGTCEASYGQKPRHLERVA